jgi:hypothetical protein
MPTPVSVAKPSPFDSAINSEDLASSTASTMPIASASDAFLPLHYSHPCWKDNVKALAQKRALSEITNLRFDQILFEELIFERTLSSTLPYDAEKTESAVDSIFVLCSTTSGSSASHSSPDYLSSELIWGVSKHCFNLAVFSSE